MDAVSAGNELSAYVLAGGRSSRMGRDKALMELAGKPLIAHAVTKLRRLTPHVHILSSNPALARYAPLVPDIHPDTGPIGGIEAALTHSALLHSAQAWNLIYPVDVPFLPTLFLERWVRGVTQRQIRPMEVALFSVYGRPQPTLLLIRSAAAPFLTQAIERGEYKLLAALETAARELAPQDASPPGRVPYRLPVDEHMRFDDWEVAPPNPMPWQLLTASQRAAQPLWFSNLNTPADFAEAEAHVDALDT